MPRRTATVTITTEGRDRNKQFRITEMPADDAERWAIRAVMAFANAGARLPEGTLEAGMSGLAASMPGLIIQGLRSLAGLRYDDVEALLTEMMECVQFVPSGNLPPQPLFRGANCQIEEVRTRLQLRQEVLQIHMDPSLAAALSASTASPQAPSA